MGNPIVKMFDICCNHSFDMKGIIRRKQTKSLLHQESIHDLQEMQKDLSNRIFGRIKMHNGCYENSKSYLQLYQIILKDCRKFQSIRMKSSNFSFESDFHNTAIFEPEIEQCEPSSQTTFEYYLNFMSREIIKGNSIIIELIVNFGDIYDKSINKLQTKDLNRFNTKVQKALSEIKIFLFEPLDELINYFYSSAIENIVVEILRMKKTFIRFFKQNLIHFLAFKETPKIFEQINKLCSKSTSFIRKKKLPTKLRSIKAASLLKDCILDEESITMIENEQKFNKIINYLRQLKTIKTPYEKLNHINYLNKKIVKILDRLIKHHRISYEVEGKISLMSYLLVKSEYVEINSDIEFLQMFYDDDMKDIYEEFDTVYHYEILFSTLKLLQQ